MKHFKQKKYTYAILEYHLSKKNEPLHEVTRSSNRKVIGHSSLDMEANSSNLDLNDINKMPLSHYFDILSYPSFTMVNKPYQRLFDRKRIELLREQNQLHGRAFNAGLPITYEENNKLVELINKGYTSEGISKFFRR